MQLTAINWLIIIIGVLLCFAGVVFKKIFEAILGFVWGFSLTYLILIIMALMGTSAIREMDDSTSVVVLVVIGLIFAVLTVYLERLLITIHAFVISFSIIFLLMALAMQDSDFSIALVIAIVVAGIISMVMWNYYVYAFIIETAVTGAIMINHVGLFGSIDMFEYGSSDNGGVILITCVVAIAGIAVQSMLLKKLENGIPGENKVSLNELWGKKSSINEMFPATEIKKGNLSGVRFYEKLLIWAPIFAYVVFRLMTQYQMNPPSLAIDRFLQSSWEIRYMLQMVFQGIFIGGIIFFTVYYERKVAALYQLLYFLWIPFELYNMSRYNNSNFFYSGARNVIVQLFKFVLVWLITLAIDTTVKNEKLKLMVSVIIAILLYPFVINYLSSGWVDVYIRKEVIICWVSMSGTVCLMSYLRNANFDKYCSKCGIKRIDEDCFCRKCGNKY